MRKEVKKMKRVKRRTFYGAICEQEVYGIRENQNIKAAEPREPRFQTEEERAAHREAISRKRHTQLFNANFDHNSIYSTLTLDSDNEVHEFEEMKRLRDNYIRRLKRRFPDAVIFAYIGKGKNTHRLHMHMVSNGIPEDDIAGLWKYGSVVRIDRLRMHNMYNGVDHGEDYTALANYLFDHWTPEQGGHRWKNTRNALQPMREDPKEIIREYSETKPPRAPKGYKLVEARGTKYGYLFFKYIKIPESRYKTRKQQGS